MKRFAQGLGFRGLGFKGLGFKVKVAQVHLEMPKCEHVTRVLNIGVP